MDRANWALWNWEVVSLICAMTVVLAGIGLFWEFQRRFIGLLCFTGFLIFYFLNPASISVATGMVGWLLLWIIAQPRNAKWNDSAWNFHPWSQEVLWIVMGITYADAGLAKLLQPLWFQGQALESIAQVGPSMVPGFGRKIMAESSLIAKAATWAAMAVQCGAIMPIFWKRSRIFFWWALTLMHLSIAGLFVLQVLPVYMLACQALMFDYNFLPQLKAKRVLA
ncbi:HTTM domain-containing protein [Bdellovibrio sp. HCB288]|uniref:HTTM domain-containing protein n=1 Tax=Bdellovibrio sp. HCB288 TaxID=3394355 RepID=UPI0039B4A79F